MSTLSSVDSTAGEHLVPEMPFPIALTDKAAEMAKQAMAQENLPEHALRVGVVGGGCSGLQYLLDFAEKAGDEDFVAEIQGVRVLIDPYSAAHLAGTTIDYQDSLQGAGFRFENPNVIRSCGCGSSFST